MAMLVLDAEKRDTSVRAKNVRKDKKIPGICYGHGFEPVPVQVDYQGFRKLYREASTTQVFNLNIAGQEVPVLIHEIAFNPLTNFVDHIDFMKINLKEEVDATVPVELDGVSSAVKNFGATISHIKHEIIVRCLPMDIPHEITIDISKLENIGDAVYVKDLMLGNKVEVLEEAEDVIVTVVPPKDYVEESVEVPEELKQEPTAAADGEKKEDKKEDKKD